MYGATAAHTVDEWVVYAPVYEGTGTYPIGYGPQLSGRWVRVVEPVIGVPLKPITQTIRERVLRRMLADEVERQRALRRLAAAQASRPLQVAPLPTATMARARPGVAPFHFGFEQRQRWGTRRGNRKAPYVPRRLAHPTL
jgi:hypothetical protein